MENDDRTLARPSLRRRGGVIAAIVVAVALAALWPAMWARSNHGAEAMLGAGTEGPSSALIDRELPSAPRFVGLGHDGQQFYAVARHPFDPPAARDQLDSPAYRYRRILFPAIAGVLAPGGGRTLVFTLLGVSLAGVALGAWATSRLPGAPAWLPIAVGLTPGVGVALALSLSDALATGLTLAAVAASLRQRWATMTIALIGAALTRETLLLVAVGLLLTPGLPTRWRVASVVAPFGIAGGWALWSAHALGTPLLEGSGQVGPPLLGWLQSDSSPRGLVVGILTTIVLAVGAWRTRYTDRAVSIVLGLHAALMACLATDVTTSWLNTTRVAAPVFALAVWSIVRSEPATSAIGPSAPTATLPSPPLGPRPATLVSA